jgi:GNAT superfamily N-acetyltransferase
MGKITSPAPIRKEHQTQGFDCSIPSLNEWLTRRAMKNEYSGASRTYVVCIEDRAIGYYALAAGSVARKDVPGKIKRNMPEPIPVLVLGRLAVDYRYHGKGMGQGLMKDAVARAINVSRQIGTRALFVHSLNKNAEHFYLKYGFISGPAKNTLFLPLK